MDMKNIMIFTGGMILMFGLNQLFDSSSDEVTTEQKKVVHNTNHSNTKEELSYAEATSAKQEHTPQVTVKKRKQFNTHTKKTQTPETIDTDALLSKEYEELTVKEVNALPYEIRMDKIEELKEKWPTISEMQQKIIVDHFRNNWSSLPIEDKRILKES